MTIGAPGAPRSRMATTAGVPQHGGMRPRTGLARLGAVGVALAAAALAGGILVPGEVGALLRGYGAMLVPAVAWLYAGIGLRAVLPRRGAAATRGKVVISARDGSLRV